MSNRISVCVAAVASVVVTLVVFYSSRRDAVVVATADERRELEIDDAGDDDLKGDDAHVDTTNDGVEDPPWGAPVDGLQYRLRAERLTWPSWQRPVVLLDVRNASQALIPAKTLQELLTLKYHLRGPLILRKPKDPAETEDFEYEIKVEADPQSLTELKPGESQSLPVALRSITRRFPDSLQPDQITIGLGRQRRMPQPKFYSNFLSLRFLPPGVRTGQALDALLKTYAVKDQSIEAGFVLSGTTLVEGEPAVLTFVVRNASQKLLTYTFGGDSRGVNRHNRFAIEVRDRRGNLLDDPLGANSGGGCHLSQRRVAPGRVDTEALDLEKYRKIPGSGRYTVVARFILTNDLGPDEGDFKVPVESKLRLTILPRTAENVASVLQRQFARCERTSGRPLDELIDTICEFGREAAVDGLSRLAREGELARRRAAIRGLGQIASPSALAVLLPLERETEVRVAALKALGSFVDESAMERAASVVEDSDAEVRTAAAAALGRMKNHTAVETLIERVNAAESSADKSVILAALGESRTPQAFKRISESLHDGDVAVRRAAVSAIVRFDAADAAQALLPYAEDADLNFRETVVETLADRLRQPIQAEWLSPVIRSRRARQSLGDAPRLLRMYTDDKAAPTLLSCLDFDDPSVGNPHNGRLIEAQLSCRTGLAIPWITDSAREGTPAEIQQNRDTLTRLKAWVALYESAPWRDRPMFPASSPGPDWGPEQNGFRIHARVNCSVWPEGLPQVVTFDAMYPSGSMTFTGRPAVYELEVNGAWYAPDKARELNISGGWRTEKGYLLQSVQLTPDWKRISDGEPLALPPGEYNLRVRILPSTGTDRSRLATSQPLTFRVISANAH